MKRWLVCMPLLFVLADPVPAQEKKREPNTPTVVVRVRSLDTVIDNFKLLAGLVGKENIAQQIHGIIRTKLGAKGLEGIDPARPFGFYGRIGNDFNDLAGVILVPVKDEKTILGLLENLNLKVTKSNDGIYTVATGTPVDAHFRFHKGYAYVTALNVGSLAADQILDPATVFPAGQSALFSATLRIDQIPEVAKKLALSGVEDKLEQLAAKQPNESDLQHALRVESQKEFLRRLNILLNDGQELQAEFDLSPKTKELIATFTLGARPKSELAGLIAELGKTPSVFGGIKSDKAVLDGRVHVTIPPPVAQALERGLKDEFAKGIAGITDESKRKQAEHLAQTLLAGIRAGEIDAMVQLNAKDKHYNVVAGIKFLEADKLGKLVHDLATDLLQDAPPAERDKVKLNAESVGNIKIHRVDVQHTFDPKAREVLGDNPLYVAFRKDAVLVAVGEGGLDALKSVLTAPGGPGPAVRIDVAVARLAPLLAENDEQRAALGKMISDDGRVRLSVQGGTTLRGEFTAQLSVVRFFATFATKGRFKARR